MVSAVDPQAIGRRVFAYWNSADQSPISEMVSSWSRQFEEFRVIGDDDVLPILERHFPDFVGVYEAIRIPAARSDVARLLYMYEHGGFYVDCHYALRDVAGTIDLIGKLGTYDAIFVNRDIKVRAPETYRLINGVQLGRPKLPLFIDVARQALTNLAGQREIEEKNGFVAYNIYSLSGPGLLTNHLMQRGENGLELKDDFRGRIFVIGEEVMPIDRDALRTYTKDGLQWHKRQTSELLFQPA